MDEEQQTNDELIAPDSEQYDETEEGDDQAYYDAYDDEPEEGEEEETQTTSAAQQPATGQGGSSSDVPYIVPNQMTEAELEQLREDLLTDSVGTINRMIRQALSTHDSVRAVQQSHLAELANTAPEFVRTHQPVMEHALSTLPPEQRATKAGVDYAVLYAVGNRAQKVGVAQAIQEAAAQFTRSAKPQNQTATGSQTATGGKPAGKPALAPLPASQRVTTPTVATTANRTTAKPQTARNPQQSVVARMAARTGLSHSAVRAMLAEADQLR